MDHAFLGSLCTSASGTGAAASGGGSRDTAGYPQKLQRSGGVTSPLGGAGGISAGGSSEADET